MDDIETLIEALHSLYASLEKLRNFEGPEFLLPGRIEQYHSALEDAYAAYGKIETTIDELDQELDYHHTRLDKAVKQFGEG
jgi:hypothetical protein